MNHAACDCSRRRFLTQLGAGFGTLAFEALLHEQARAATSTVPSGDRSPSPVRASRAPFRAAGQVGDLYLTSSAARRRLIRSTTNRNSNVLSGQPLPAVSGWGHRANKIRERHTWLRSQTARQPLLVATIRRIRHVGQRTVPANRPARRQALLHPLDAVGLEQSRPLQLPVPHRRHTRRQGKSWLLDNLRFGFRKPGLARLRRAVRRRPARRRGQLFQWLPARRVSAHAIARQRNAGPRSATTARICRWPASLARSGP